MNASPSRPGMSSSTFGGYRSIGRASSIIVADAAPAAARSFAEAAPSAGRSRSRRPRNASKKQHTQRYRNRSAWQPRRLLGSSRIALNTPPFVCSNTNRSAPSGSSISLPCHPRPFRAGHRWDEPFPRPAPPRSCIVTTSSRGGDQRRRVPPSVVVSLSAQCRAGWL